MKRLVVAVGLVLVLILALVLGLYFDVLPSSQPLVLPPVASEGGKYALIMSGAAKNETDRSVFDSNIANWDEFLGDNGWTTYVVGFNEQALDGGLAWLRDKSGEDNELGFFYLGHGNRRSLYLGAAMMKGVPPEEEYLYGIDMTDKLTDFFDDSVDYNKLIIIMDHSLSGAWENPLEGEDRIVITGSGTTSRPRLSMLYMLRERMINEDESLEQAFAYTKDNFEKEYKTIPRIADNIDGEYYF